MPVRKVGNRVCLGSYFCRPFSNALNVISNGDRIEIMKKILRLSLVPEQNLQISKTNLKLQINVMTITCPFA